MVSASKRWKICDRSVIHAFLLSHIRQICTFFHTAVTARIQIACFCHEFLRISGVLWSIVSHTIPMLDEKSGEKEELRRFGGSPAFDSYLSHAHPFRLQPSRFRCCTHLACFGHYDFVHYPRIERF